MIIMLTLHDNHFMESVNEKPLKDEVSTAQFSKSKESRIYRWSFL